jgi:hypothetical protein
LLDKLTLGGVWKFPFLEESVESFRVRRRHLVQTIDG